MAERAALAVSPSPAMSAMTSYQMPVRALPKSGLSFSTAVFATRRSMISPGILDESNTSWAPGVFRISETMGFQVVTAVTSGVLYAATMSASEVFTSVMSRSLSPALSSARARR